MIPKVIHYCWFGGGKKSELILRCIASWKKWAPDFQIIEWNEKNFDINLFEYSKEAYREKKFAFVSDVARFWILKEYGGIYLDTDVELLQPIEAFLRYRLFMGFESDEFLAPGLIMGAEKEEPILTQLCAFYQTNHFVGDSSSGIKMTVCDITSHLMQKFGFVMNGQYQEINGRVLFPKEYFCPLDFRTGRISKLDKAYSIHYYSASWYTQAEREKLKKMQFFSRYIGTVWARRLVDNFYMCKNQGMGAVFEKIKNKLGE